MFTSTGSVWWLVSHFYSAAVWTWLFRSIQNCFSSSFFSFFGLLSVPLPSPSHNASVQQESITMTGSERTRAHFQADIKSHVLIVCRVSAHVVFIAWFAAWLHYDALQTHSSSWLAHCQGHDVTSCCRNKLVFTRKTPFWMLPEAGSWVLFVIFAWFCLEPISKSVCM